MTEHKALARVEIKDADRGEVVAVFSTFDVIDKDGDVTRKGAFTDGAPVVISAYGHKSWDGTLPVGKGQIRELDTEAVMEGRFLMDTTHGRDTFLTVKALSEGESLQEWSYSLEDVKSHKGTFQGQPVRFIDSVAVKEVSPVLVGAGVDTRTLSTKAKQLSSDLHRALTEAGRERFAADGTDVWLDDFDLDESWAVFQVWSDADTGLWRVPFTRDGNDVTLGDDQEQVDRTTSYVGKSQTFSEHAASVLADVDALITRASEVMALRATKGKGIAPASADLLSTLTADLDRLKGLLNGSPPSTDDLSDDALAAEFARFVALTNGAAR